MQDKLRGNKTLIWVAALVFLLFLAGSLVFVYSVQQRNENRIVDYLHDAMKQRQTALMRQINSDFQLLDGVAVMFAEMNLDDAESITRVLDSINQGNTFQRMGIADAHGLVDFIDLNGKVLPSIDVSAMNVYQRARAGTEAVSETFYERETGEYVNYYAVPIYRDEAVVSVLCAVNRETVMQNLIAVPVFQGEGYFAIINTDGVIMTPTIDPNPAVVVGASVFDIITAKPAVAQQMHATLQSLAVGDFVFDINGVEYLSSITPLGLNSWSVICVVPHDSINTYYNQTAIGTFIIILAACLVFVFLLVWQLRAENKNRASLERLAYTDLLTGARNYTKFLMDAEAILTAHPHHRYAVWSFDIKKFNSINDVFGTDIGDEVLKRMAREFEHGCQDDAEAIFCRIAADQFAGLRPYGSQEELCHWFWAFYHRLSQREVIPEDRMRIDVSMGFYCTGDFDGQLMVDEMANRAAIAKKAAKEAPGTEALFFTREMGDTLRWETELAAAGPEALQSGEFTFFLQPKVDIQNGLRIHNAEALVRWNHPTRGWIAPDSFIPLFEQNGFVVDVDRYIFEQVCAWYVDARKRGCPPMLVSVNVSRRGLMHEDIVDFYVSTRQRYGIGPGEVELEFTEGVVVDGYEAFHDLVLQFQENGFICSIDDFGSGYSSLNVLKNLPINVLKLDAMFLRNSIDIRRERIVIENFLTMAQQLGIETVAEGVETKEQVAFLQQAGCNLVQGYVFSKPLPAEDFEALLTQTNATMTLE